MTFPVIFSHSKGIVLEKIPYPETTSDLTQGQWSFPGGRHTYNKIQGVASLVPLQQKNKEAAKCLKVVGTKTMCHHREASTYEDQTFYSSYYRFLGMPFIIFRTVWMKIKMVVLTTTTHLLVPFHHLFHPSLLSM